MVLRGGKGKEKLRRGNPKNLGQQLFANLYFSVLITGNITPVPAGSALFKISRIRCR